LSSSRFSWNTLSPLGSIYCRNFVQPLFKHFRSLLIYVFKLSFKPSISYFKPFFKPSILASISFFVTIYNSKISCTSSHNFDLSCRIYSSSLCVIVEIFGFLLGVSIFFLFPGILEPNNDIYASLFSLNHFKLIFQTKVMQI